MIEEDLECVNLGAEKARQNKNYYYDNVKTDQVASVILIFASAIMKVSYNYRRS
jgi:hypothetical protein